MSQLAVIKTGGKQYKVSQGQILKVEKLTQAVGSEFEFDQVLLVADQGATHVQVGNPLIKDAKIKAKVLEQGRADKIRVVHYKPKTRHHKVYGHRQPFTKVEILSVA